MSSQRAASGEKDRRLEIKCVLESGRGVDVESWLALNAAAFREAYPERRVNNIYFDSPELGCFGENLSGVSGRTKCRLRWYGESAVVRSAVLEIKEKRNLSGTKRKHEVRLPAPLEELSYEEISSAINAALPESARVALAGMAQAVLLNHYRRRYFVSFDGRTRITLDRDLTFYDQRPSLKPDMRFRVHSPSFAVLECKFDAKDELHTRRSVSGLPARVTKCSKYALGVQWLLGF